jgi:cobalt-zinc-cadmium efflux system membrane fusion protein
LRAGANTVKTILLKGKVDIMLKRFAFSCVAVAIAGCSASETAAPPPAAPMAVKTAVAVAAGEIVLATLPATVVQPPGARVAVTAPLAGLVRDVAVQPGQAVRRGQVLATLISRDAMQMAAELSRAEARRQLTAAERARMEALARAGVVAGARADSAAAADAEARISVEAALRMLAQMGADRSGSVRMVAPIRYL